MKMMVGMGSIEDYSSYVKAGADEIFIGYVPNFWVHKYGVDCPLNRREVLYYNVQIGSFSELMILSDMVKKYDIPVSITLNALHYEKECYEDLFSIIESCMSIGFYRFILADPEFLQALFRKRYEGIELVVSGEYGEMNEALLDYLWEKRVKRIIFPRQTTLEEMEELILRFPELEYEAFTLNEKCHFTGAYCNSVHCDEFCHMCRVPYELDGDFSAQKEQIFEMDPEEEILGSSGCALCALWDFQRIGITHLKLVSRGNGSEDTENDIKKVKKALSTLNQCQSRAEYIRLMKEKLFPHGCGKNCYVSLPETI